MKDLKRLQTFLIAVTLAMALVACVGGDSVSGSTETTTISFHGDSITVEGSGAVVDRSTVTITSAGTYILSGTLGDGQVRVSAGDADTVRLVLSGVDLSGSTGAPVYITSADKTIITLEGGTQNSITDGPSYTFAETGSDEPDAALFSRDDLTINGEGSLVVTGNYNDGITSKDDLKITGGSIVVKAVNDGVRGRDSVTIRDGEILITAAGDGIQSNNDEDTEKGYITIEGGSVRVSAGADGIQAEHGLSITGGDVTVTSGRNSTADSGKGLKAGVSLTVTGGTISVDSADDAVHSDGTISIQGGTISISSGDDAVHADSSLEIDGGEIVITGCYEGLDSAAITINGGDIHLAASDDGVNAVTKGEGSTDMQQRPGRGMEMLTGTNTLSINGGYLYVDAGGDGIDINGPITMTGGTVIVNGPTDNGNGALDYTGIFAITGGTLVAAGSAGMAMAPGSSSGQPSVMLVLSAAKPGGTLVHIETSDGEDVLTFAPLKTYQSVVFSSPLLVREGDYVMYTGGSMTGTQKDGLYSGGTYTPGEKVAEFSLTGMVTTVGSGANQRTGFMPGNVYNATQGNRSADYPGAMQGNMTGGMPVFRPGKTGNPIPGYTGGGMTGYVPGAILTSTKNSIPGMNSGSQVTREIPGFMPGVSGTGTWSPGGKNNILQNSLPRYSVNADALRIIAGYATMVPPD